VHEHIARPNSLKRLQGPTLRQESRPVSGTLATVSRPIAHPWAISLLAPSRVLKHVESNAPTFWNCFDVTASPPQLRTPACSAPCFYSVGLPLLALFASFEAARACQAARRDGRRFPASNTDVQQSLSVRHQMKRCSSAVHPAGRMAGCPHRRIPRPMGTALHRRLTLSLSRLPSIHAIDSQLLPLGYGMEGLVTGS